VSGNDRSPVYEHNHKDEPVFHPGKMLESARKLIAARQEEGIIALEMEAAALLAMMAMRPPRRSAPLHLQPF